MFDDKLKWEDNTDQIIKKCNQRMYFLRKLNSFSVDTKILKLFYSSFIESVLCFSFICWFYNLNLKQKTSLQRVVNTCSKIVGAPLRSLSQFCDQQTIKKARSIIASPDHVLNVLFQFLPSNRRLRTVLAKTNRRGNSFIPTAIRLLNECERERPEMLEDDD